MKVRKAKKMLKSEFDLIHEKKKKYKSVVWNKRRKLFLCVSIWGQSYLITI